MHICKTSSAGTSEPQLAMLSTLDAALRLGLRPSTLEKWRTTGGGPRYVKMGRAVRYRLADLDVFTTERMCAHTAQYK